MAMADRTKPRFAGGPRAWQEPLRLSLRALGLLAAWQVALGMMVCASAAELSPADRDFFENRIRPLLAEHCYECHAAETGTAEASLELDSRAGLLRGGDAGPAIEPGDPDASRLIEAVRYENVDLQMPPAGKLKPQEIDALTEWVRRGAPDPRDAEPSTSRAPLEFDWRSRASAHWAWQPLQQPAVPAVRRAAWPRTDVDRFVLARLEAAGLEPAEEASRLAWLRRVTFDLIGLPPTPAEAVEFLADESPQAYQRVVDRLLASPHYGEQWGQHWLDLVRYAETRGHEQDFDIPEAWRYRDYVIRAFNQDVPYDQWIIEHVAGDLVPAPRLDSEDRSNQSIQGTGFWHLGEATHSPVDIEGDEAERFHNQIDVFSRAFLGLSMGCARCHDHKFDAISAQDYYALYGYLQSSSYQLADVSDPQRRAEIIAGLEQWRCEQMPDARRRLATLRQEQLAELERDLVAAAALVAGAHEELAEASEARRQRLNKLTEHLRAAAESPHDLLYSFAHAATAPQDGRSRGAAAQQQLRELWNRQQHDAAITGHDERSLVRVIENFAALSDAADRWIVAGERFGTGPSEPGELLFEHNDVAGWHVADSQAAVSNRLSGKLRGMLRTRTFEITGPRLWYRYRGSADVFLAVDSHRVVAGPLHGVVRQSLDGDPHQWRWFAHPVGDYMGHRVHVEFTPKGEAPFALDRVEFRDEPPTEGPSLCRAQFEQTRTALAGDRPWETELARATVAPLAGAVERFATGEADADDARVLNWLAQHDALLCQEVASRSRFDAASSAQATARAAWETRIPVPTLALALLDGSAEDEPVHIRGNHRTRSPQPVPRRLLAALGGELHPRPSRGSGRLDLARRMADPENPLVTRVYVNRVWAQLLGQGLVETVDDFGAMGNPPTHPELLDFLAQQFVAHGWSTKWLVRELVLSAVYRQSSRAHAPAEEADPKNALWGRALVRRLPAESIRDSWLAVSGRLERRLYGPSVMVHISDFMRGNRSPGGSGPLDGEGRRSIYTEVRRNHLAAALAAFDKPVPFNAIGRRGVSNSPAQALILMNDPLVHQQAALWAERLAAETQTVSERIERAFWEAYTRQPTAAELDALQQFVEQQTAAYAQADEPQAAPKAWADACHALLCAKEFIYLE